MEARASSSDRESTTSFAERRRLHRWLSWLATAVVFVFIFRRVPVARLLTALEQADLARFFGLMVPNTVFYFCWDTLVLTVAVRWFHARVAYRDLLPVRAASYVVAAFNTNLGRGALAAYLSRRLAAPFLELGSTVLFLLLTEYLHLVAWATVGIVAFASEETRELLWVPPVVAVAWLLLVSYMRAPAPERGGALLAPRRWAVFRSLRLAPARRYLQLVLLRSPMFLVSLCLHYLAAPAFGVVIPFGQMMIFLPVIFMLAALPISVAHLGTTQAAWLVFFGRYAPAPRLLAFSLAAHLAFVATRALLGLAFLPWAYDDLVHSRREGEPRPIS
ncbi:MAG TPA: hypothetical protein VGQ78_02795 [Vicinamibacteria bacterium]|nr:hypothetical protein [Vicinamibacteria bacterium]